jgi:hypothetical protein
MKQRLRPLTVPWMVSPSVSNLRLITCEDCVAAPTHVRFFAHFGLRAETTTSQRVGFPTAEIAIDPGTCCLQDAADGLVEIAFEWCLWTRTSPAFSDRHVLNPDEFDESAIPYSVPPADIEAWQRDFQSLWLKTGNCPDPRAYLVESSAWLATLNLHGYEHIVIEGHDAFVEVLAKSWQWREVTSSTLDSSPQAPHG